MIKKPVYWKPVGNYTKPRKNNFTIFGKWDVRVLFVDCIRTYYEHALPLCTIYYYVQAQMASIDAEIKNAEKFLELKSHYEKEKLEDKAEIEQLKKVICTT